MANIRLKNPAVRLYLASPLAFADWQNPTTAELNANPTNDPNGLIWNLSCALSQSDTTFDLADSDTDDELTFCQVAGAVNPTTYNTDIVYTAFRSDVPWVTSDPATFNTANLAHSLLQWRGVEYFAIASVGKDAGENFAVDDRVKMARVATDNGVDLKGTGEMLKIQSTFLSRGDINWNYRLAA